MKNKPKEVKVQKAKPSSRKTKGKSDAVCLSTSISKSSLSKSKSLQEAIDNSVVGGFADNGSYLEYPFNADYAALYFNRDVTHKASWLKLTTLIAGLGYEFKNKSEKDKEVMEKVLDFAKNPNDNINNSFRTLLYDFTKDYLAFANGYGSIRIDDKKEMKVSMYYLNSYTHRVVPERDKKHKMIAGNVKGIKQVMSSNSILSGVFYPILSVRREMAEGKRYGFYLNKGLAINSDFYGDPDYLPALTLIEENLTWQSFYYDFGQNNAQPNLLISIIGDEWSDAVKTTIQSYMQDNFKGEGNQNRTLILNFPDSDVRVEVTQLSQKIDSSFLEKINSNDLKIARAWQMQPKLLGISQGVNSGGTENTGSMKEFLENVVIPVQDAIESFFNKVLEKAFGVNPELKLNTATITSLKDKAVVASLLNKIVDENGVSVINKIEVRQMVGLSEFLGNPLGALLQSEESASLETTEEGETVGDDLQIVPDDVTGTEPDKNS